MALPKQVQRDLDEIKAYDEAMLAEQTGAPAPVEQPEPVAVEPVVAVVPAPEVQEVVEPVSNVVELKPAVDEEMTWKQRYKTLDGMIEAENRRNKELHGTVQQLQAEITTLKAVPKPATPSAPLITDQELEDLGIDKETIDVQRRVAREALAPLQAKLDSLEAENGNLRAQIGQTGYQVANLSFEQKLQDKVPDFEAINADPKWVAWLDEVDPILRAPRRTVAQAAFERGDADAVAAYVTLFRSTAKPVEPLTRSTDSELRQQVAPSRSVSAATAPQGEQARIYTEAEASTLFDKVGLLYRQGKNEEASKLETELTVAYNTGRVR